MAVETPNYGERNIIETKMFHAAIDRVFETTAKVVEVAVISSNYHAEAVKGIRGKEVFVLKEFL